MQAAYKVTTKSGEATLTLTVASKPPELTSQSGSDPANTVGALAIAGDTESVKSVRDILGQVRGAAGHKLNLDSITATDLKVALIKAKPLGLQFKVVDTGKATINTEKISLGLPEGAIS